MSEELQHKKKKRRIRKERPVIEAIPSESGENSRFARALGSSDPLTRKKAVAALQRWLQIRSEIREGELVRIWKGLFYCFWHSDLAPVQEELAEQLAGILPQLAPEVGLSYFAVFVRTMRREWFGIDRHRLDKFLMLIRHFVRQLLVLLRASNWSAEAVGPYTALIRDEVLLPSDTIMASGVAYHVADIWLPELLRVMGGGSSDGGGGGRSNGGDGGGGGRKRMSNKALRRVLAPFEEALVRTTQQALLNRIMDGMFEPLCEELAEPSEGDLLGRLQAAQYGEALFDLGAQPEVRSQNRDCLYHVHERLTGVARQRERSAAEEGAGARGDPDAAAHPHGRTAAVRSATKAADKATATAAAAAKEEGGGGQRDVEMGDGPAAAQREEEEAVAAAARPVKKKVKVAKLARRQVSEAAAAESPVIPSTAAAVSAGGGSKQKAAAVTAAGGSKQKRAAAAVEQAPQQRQQQQQSNGASASPAAVPLAGSVSAVKKSKKKRKAAEEAEEGGGAARGGGSGDTPRANGTPAVLPANGVHAAAAAEATPKQRPKQQRQQRPTDAATDPHKPKSVRWGLRHNLVLTLGQPPPPADIRTPPRAQPKGSAIKQASLEAMQQQQQRSGVRQGHAMLNGGGSSNGSAPRSQQRRGRAGARTRLSMPNMDASPGY